MPKRLVIFDLDGTLIDSLEDLGAAVNHALSLRNLPLHTREDYRKMVGHGVRNLVEKALEDSVGPMVSEGKVAFGGQMTEVNYFSGRCPKNQFPSIETRPDNPKDKFPSVETRPDNPKNQFPSARTDSYVDAALADFKEYYSAHIDVHTRPYPGIPELLADLQAAGVRLAVASNKFQEGTERLIRSLFPDIQFVAILGNRPGYPLKPAPEIVQEVLRKADIGPSDAVMVGDSPTDMRTAANGGIEGLAVTWGYRTADELAGHRLVHSVPELRGLLFQ